MPKFTVLTEGVVPDLMRMCQIGFDPMPMQAKAVDTHGMEEFTRYLFEPELGLINTCVAENEAFLVNGSKGVGKTTMLKQQNFDLVDCIPLGTLTQTVD